MTRSPDHDILARIVALLLGLAALAEWAASRPLAVRLAILWIVLPAQHAALTLLDIPADDADPRPSQQSPAPRRSATASAPCSASPSVFAPSRRSCSMPA